MHTEESSDDADANHFDGSGWSVVLCKSFKDIIMRKICNVIVLIQRE